LKYPTDATAQKWFRLTAPDLAGEINSWFVILTKNKYLCLLYLISGFRREVDENSELVTYYSARIGNFLETFWDNLSVTSSRVKNSWMGQTGGHDTSVRNYQFLLSINPKERSYTYRQKPESLHVENCKNGYCFIVER
jgi:hypothetical protein